MRSISSWVLLAICLAFSSAAHAGEREFFSNIKGSWTGPGAIVAGKYKGTRFMCNFAGATSERDLGMEISGSCRVGVFPQDMNAEIVKKDGVYKGKFLDGQNGEGMDIRGGRYTKDRLVVDIIRNDLNGIMVANLQDPNQLKITVSVRTNGKLVPVIGMNLARQPGNIVTSTIQQ